MVLIFLIVYQPTSTCGIKRKPTKKRRVRLTAHAKGRLQSGPNPLSRRQQVRKVPAPKKPPTTKTSSKAEVVTGMTGTEFVL